MPLHWTLVLAAALAQGAAEAQFQPQSDADAQADLPENAALDAAAETTPDQPLYETTVRTSPLEVDNTARATHTVGLNRLRTRAADLGLILRETPGVTVRQAGGLGSQSQLTLNGLTGLQVPVFVDGIPIELTGMPRDITAVPVALVRRMELIKGVVPIEYGGDALGGAVDLITYDPAASRAYAGVELASFGTQRVVADTAVVFEPFTLTAQGYFDHSTNDYVMPVEVTGPLGQIATDRVRRFHSAYRIYGGNLGLHMRDKAWGDALDVTAFANKQTQDIQHGRFVGLQPFGAVESGDESFGGTVRYRKNAIADKMKLDAALSVSHRTTRLLDVSTNIYDWYGDVTGQLPTPGELRIAPNGVDQTVATTTVWARTNLEWSFTPSHRLALNVTPVVRQREIYNRLSASGRQTPAKATELTGGLAYRSSWLEGTLENDGFGKLYYYQTATDETRVGFNLGRVRQDYFRGGLGDALVYRITETMRVRASYELATRLPEPDEIFGDGVLVSSNPHLEAESSHNLNAAFAITDIRLPFGELSAQTWAFYRRVQNLIFLEAGETLSRFSNIETVQIRGLELQTELVAKLFRGGFNATYEESKNTSLAGGFSRFANDRIPNRPYLYGSAHAGVRFRDLNDWLPRIDVYSSGRYTHGYYISWESAGAPATKSRVPSQFAWDAGSSVTLGSSQRALFTTAFEVRNLTDAALSDYFGVPRPGRSFHFKISAEFE